MESPRISILLPVRNEERLLPQALESLFRQSYSRWELVAVDDHSTDGTPEILTRAAKNDRRVKLFKPSAKGLVNALNEGLDHCRGELVARMDGDDISHPRRLESQLKVLDSNPELGLVACSFRHFPRHQIRRGMLAYESWQNSLLSHDEIIRDLFVESPFVHPSVMFRKEVVADAGGYRDMGWAEDYDLWLRLSASGVRFARLHQPLFFWRERPERATRNLNEYTADAFRACKAHHLASGFLRGTSSVILAGAGLEGRKWRKALSAEGIGVSIWVDVDRRKIGRILHGAPVVSAKEVQPGETKMLITVGTPGARAGVRKWAIEAGFLEGTDFLCVT